MTEEQAASQEQAAEENEEQPGGSMTLMEHLEELRQRLTRAAIAVGVGFLIAYFFKEQLYNLLLIPLKEAMPRRGPLIYTAPAEAFFTYLKVALLAALIAASPVVFYQIWRFVSPGLYRNEKRALWMFVGFSSLLFIVGALFCYAVVFPTAFTFFMSFATEDITPMLSLKQYLSFSGMLLLAFGVVFEMPLALIFLGRLGIVNAQMLRKQRKFAILIMFVAGAFFTPPDVVSQIMMACPLLVLYEISIWMVAASQKKKEAKQAAHGSRVRGRARSRPLTNPKPN
jgi:sec-independent protein translocase protein TatC